MAIMKKSISKHKKSISKFRKNPDEKVNRHFKETVKMWLKKIFGVVSAHRRITAGVIFMAATLLIAGICLSNKITSNSKIGYIAQQSDVLKDANDGINTATSEYKIRQDEKKNEQILAADSDEIKKWDIQDNEGDAGADSDEDANKDKDEVKSAVDDTQKAEKNNQNINKSGNNASGSGKDKEKTGSDTQNNNDNSSQGSDSGSKADSPSTSHSQQHEPEPEESTEDEVLIDDDSVIHIDGHDCDCPYPMLTWTTYEGHEGFFTTNDLDSSGESIPMIIELSKKNGKPTSDVIYLGSYNDVKNVMFCY